MKMRWLVAGMLIALSAAVARPQARFPPETRNAALRYWMAFAEMRDPPADKSIQDLLEETSAGDAAWDEQKLGPILDANGEAIRTMQRATQLPECDWGLEYNRGARAPISYVPRARAMARLNQLYGIRAMAKGNSQGAVDAWLAGIRFSEHLARGGTLIFALVAKSALLPDLRALASEDRQGHFSDAQKKQIAAAVHTLREDGFDWAAAWGLETTTLEQFLAELRGAPNPPELYELVAGQALPHGAGVPSPEDARRFQAYMNSVQTALNLPPAATTARLEALEPQRRTLPEAIQRLIPSAQKVNSARVEVLNARKGLLENVTGR